MQEIALVGQGIFVGCFVPKIKTEFALAEIFPESPVIIVSLTKTNTKRRLSMVGFRERYRRDHAAAEAHVDKKCLVRVSSSYKQTQVIGVRDVTALGTHHGGRYTGNVEADFRQSPTEQAVLLIAPSAALPQDDFLVGIGRVRGQFCTELHIEVLERHALHVMCEQSAEHVQRWRRFVIE